MPTASRRIQFTLSEIYELQSAVNHKMLVYAFEIGRSRSIEEATQWIRRYETLALARRKLWIGQAGRRSAIQQYKRDLDRLSQLKEGIGKGRGAKTASPVR